MENDLNKNLKAVLTTRLGLSENAVFKIKPALSGNVLLRPDIMIEDRNRKVILEIRKKAGMDPVSKLALFQRYLKNDEIEYCIASMIILEEIESLANDLNIMMIRIPAGLKIMDTSTEKRPKGKITSEKSWKVLTRIMIEGITSIRNVSKKEGISYAWTHKTISSLIQLKIVEKDGDLIKMRDEQKALNIAAFERPFNELNVGEIIIPDDMTLRDLDRNLNEWRMDHAFTGYTAATAYIGYGSRYDSVQLYLGNSSEYDLLKDMIGKQRTGVKALVYIPDREVFKNSRNMNEITYVSPDQALLDMAGMGYSGMDLTLQMVRNYASIGSNN